MVWIKGLTNLKGSYLFIFYLNGDLQIKTKGGKKFYLPEGVYIYVGSAFGKGGIKTRIERHLRKSKKLHWHIDYVTTHKGFRFLTCIPFYGKRWECKLANFIRKLNIFQPVKGFGCSDCHCESHLFYIAKKPLEGDYTLGEILSGGIRSNPQSS